MVVHEAPERSALHRVLEVVRAIEGRDLRREVLHDAEMTCAPRDLLAQLDQPRRPAGDGSLTGVRQRPEMEVQIPRGIEALFRGSAYPAIGNDRFHGVYCRVSYKLMKVPSRRARVLLGAFGIVVGVVGFLNVLAERRAVRERQRVLTSLADDFRRNDQERRAPVPGQSVVVWEGQTFRPGDRVRIAKWAGTFKPSETGATVEVQAARGPAGVVVGGEKRQSTEYLRIDPDEPMQIVRVRWLPQRWKASGRDQWLELPEFEATIHVSHLELIRP